MSLNPDPEKAAARQDEIREEIGRLVSEYAGLYNEEFITTDWMVLVGATQMDWINGRMITFSFHPGVSYTARVGLLESAKWDLLGMSVAQNPYDEDDD